MIKLLPLFLPIFLFAQSFTIGSYNIYNLFDDHYSGSEYSDFSPAKWSTKEYRQKLTNIAKVIKELNLDIIALQEIENENTLLALKKELKVYPYHAINKKGLTPTTAFLSKYPISNTKSIKVANAPRDILKITLEVDGYKINLYNNHWASLRHSEDKRVVNVKALLDDIAKENIKEYILLGDLNSNYNRYLFQSRPVAINEYLQTIEGQSLVTLQTLTHNKHYNLWLQTPIKDRFSYIYKGKNNTLDHIILPFSLFDKKGVEYVDQSFFVFKPSYLINKRKINRAYSDHLPIAATFATTPFEKKQKNYQHATIKELFTIINKPHRIDGATITYTDRYGFIIKDKSSRSIFVYAPGIDLQAGKSYDFLIHSTKKYHGYYEVSAFDIVRKSKQSQTTLYLTQNDTITSQKQLHEVYKEVKGFYSTKGEFFYNGTTIDLYFQDKSKKPAKEGEVVLKNVRVSKYKGSLQLVVSDTSMIEVL